MINILKRLLPEKWKRNIKDNLGVPSLQHVLLHLKKIGFMPSGVIDGGAYEGIWALGFIEVFPNAKILMVEAQAVKEDCLKKICNENPKQNYAISLLSEQNGKRIFFVEDETASHVVVNKNITDSGSGFELNTKTLDTFVLEKNFGPVNFLKLDVQGHESEVLKGAVNILPGLEFCLLEVTLLELGEATVLFYDIMKQMDGYGFQVYDIAQFMRRPYDNALYQLDVLFINKKSKFMQEKRW